ncbi:hypothetical protein SAMN05443999_106200 [Roseovarius azorensis]|uniref:Uncharacterized protein n=1 Tax=Roseovarius azorensis TaxID=1287727 RepID=A0A1H7RJB5_9RHOB|nr:hypothetical protein [Roseovarius azorensis]SEL60390.1 hypothetical protein SAMN05443999_106200 [Roseovarius azorensis]
MRESVADFVEWWRLFDALCTERGHVDNGQLASEYCNLTRKQANGAYEAALKSLNNWRQGLHTPSRRNFRILTLLLRVEDMAGVLPHWNLLYEEAQRRKPPSEPENGEQRESLSAAPIQPAGAGLSVGRQIAAAVALVALGAGGGAIVTLNMVQPRGVAAVAVAGPGPDTGAPIIDMTGQRIPYREHTVVKTGQSVVIHGERSLCGEQPPPWEAVAHNLPSLAIGVWSDGGVGFRISNSCGGPTPARAVVFTATRSGEEQFYLYADPVTIRVEE